MTAPTAPRTHAPEDTTFTGAGRLLWDALPAFLVSGTVVCAVTGLVLWLTPGLTPFSALLYAVLLAPLYGALVAQSHRALEGETPGAFSLPMALRRTWRLSIGLFGSASIAIALTLVAELVWARSGAIVAAVPTAVGAVVSSLLLVGAVVGLPLGISAPRLRGIRLLLSALVVTARRPVPVIGIVAVVVIVVWAATQFSGTLLFLLPAPLAIVSVLAVRHMRAPFEADADLADGTPR